MSLTLTNFASNPVANAIVQCTMIELGVEELSENQVSKILDILNSLDLEQMRGNYTINKFSTTMGKVISEKLLAKYSKDGKTLTSSKKAKKIFAHEEDINVKDYQIEHIGKIAESNIGEEHIETQLYRNNAVDEQLKIMMKKIDRGFYRTPMISQTLVLDNYYVNAQAYFDSSITFELSTSQADNGLILMKKPLSDVAKIKVLPFTIPYYTVPSSSAVSVNSYELVKTPSKKMININVSEFTEKIKGASPNKNVIQAKCEWDLVTYDGTNLPNHNNVTPKNEGILEFSYPLKNLTSLTFGFHDLLNPMLLPAPILYASAVVYANPTIIIVDAVTDGVTNSGLFFPGTEKVYITGFNGGTTAAQNNINSPGGWIATQTATLRFSIPYDSSAEVIVPTVSFNIYIPSRRVTIPIIVYQYRTEVSDSDT